MWWNEIITGSDNKITNDVFIMRVIEVNSDWWCEVENVIWFVQILRHEASHTFSLTQVIETAYDKIV